MMLHPTYFSSILQYASILKSKELIFEIEDNFQKQTYRNRCYIYGANGKQLLNIPIQKSSSGGKQLTRDVKIDYSVKWQSEHLKSLISAYKSSPFFEFYIDDLMELFSKKEVFLMDLNLNTFQVVSEILGMEKEFKKTTSYEIAPKNDFRHLVNAKSKTDLSLEKYTQVFDNKYGFLSNLSILDLIFMEGTASLIYLERITL